MKAPPKEIITQQKKHQILIEINNMDETKAQDIVFTLDQENFKYSTINIDDLLTFIQTEKENFSWLSASNASNDQVLSTVKLGVFNLLNQIDALIIECKGIKNNPSQLEAKKKGIRHRLLNHTQQKDIILSGTAKGKYVCNIAQSNRPLAGHILAYFMGHPLSNLPISHKAASMAIAFENGSQETLTTFTDLMSNFQNKWEDKFEKLSSLTTDQRTEFDIYFTKTKKDHERFSDTLLEFHKENNLFIEDFVSEARQKIKTLEDTYDKALATKSSVTYWKEQKKTYNRAAIISCLVTIALSVSIIFSFGYISHAILTESLKDIVLWKLAIVAAISTFGIWLTRLSSKVFISNLHLRTDADERVTMILTYIALLRDELAISSDDKGVILSTLFRPSSSGIISDDGPSSFHEVLLKSMKK